MKTYLKFFTAKMLLFAPVVVYGQFTKLGEEGATFLNAATGFIFGPLLVFLLAIAFITFAWGVLKYFIADAEGDKAAAKSLMIWGIGGFVLILILFGAVNLLVDFTGLGETELKTLPSPPQSAGG